MKTFFNFTAVFFLSFLFHFGSNNNDPRTLTKQKILNSSYKTMLKYDWFKTKKYIANDEYDKWLVCEFFYSKSEKIIVTYTDLEGFAPTNIETKMNIFQDGMKLKNNISLKDISLNKYTKLERDDYGDFVIVEFDIKNNFKYFHQYKLSCSSKIELNADNIKSKLTNKKNKELSKEIQDCKLLSSLIIKNFDSNGKLLHKPL
ncbi:hypothetical protein ACFSJW_09005 [Flavobacterium artemisiae]|uniref:Uncharacterized protein n=1 Tax=Flavobacterium artemisiae TaxID=2126556 RepID=A0ABW4HFT3_9FLAO